MASIVTTISVPPEFMEMIKQAGYKPSVLVRWGYTCQDQNHNDQIIKLENKVNTISLLLDEALREKDKLMQEIEKRIDSNE